MPLANRLNIEYLTESRLDPYFYRPEFLNLERSVRARIPTFYELGDEYNVLDGTHDSVETKEAPDTQFTVPFLRSQDIGPGYLIRSNGSFIRASDHTGKCKRSAIRHGDVLLNIMASTGQACVYEESFPPAVNANRAVGILRTKVPKTPAEKRTLSVILSSSQGGMFLARSLKGSIQQRFNLEDIRECAVPRFSRAVEAFIGDKIYQAERLRALSRSIEGSLGSIFAPLTDGLPRSPKAWRASRRILDSYRVNPSHYDPVVLKMLQDARATVKVLELGGLFGDRGISGGATPLGADYRDSGVFFVRVQNVKPYRLDLSDAAYLSPEQDGQLARSRCGSDDILFSITGYPGTASLVMEEDLPVNLNQHCVRFDVRPPYDAAYLVAAMNSSFVKRQVDRLAIGGTRDALDYPSVRSLLIPLLEDPVMQEVGRRVRTLNRAERLSERLVVAARLLAEGLIEGKIAEAELIQLQDAIDKGDRSADRDVLERLTTRGIDVPGTPKLFPDLDSLYRMLLDFHPSVAEAK